MEMKAAEQAAQEFRKVFSEKKLPEEMDSLFKFHQEIIRQLI